MPGEYYVGRSGEGNAWQRVVHEACHHLAAGKTCGSLRSKHHDEFVARQVRAASPVVVVTLLVVVVTLVPVQLVLLVLLSLSLSLSCRSVVCRFWLRFHSLTPNAIHTHRTTCSCNQRDDM